MEDLKEKNSYHTLANKPVYKHGTCGCYGDDITPFPMSFVI